MSGHDQHGGRTIDAEPAARRSRARAVVVGFGMALGVAGAATVAMLALGRAGGVNASGASGPQAAVERLVEAANAEDLLGVVAAMAPDEVPDVDLVVEQVRSEADAAGIDGLDTDDGVDLELTLSDVTVSEEGDHAAIVEFTLDGSIDATALTGPLGELLPDVVEFSTIDILDNSYDPAITEIFVVTVEVDGEWYVSPMLTAGEYAVRALNLLPGDYDLIGEDTTEGGGETGEAAVASLLQGVADLDLDDVADVLSPGAARLATVFEDAIDDLLFELPPDLFSDLEVETRELDDGRVRLSEASFLLSYYDDWDGYTRSYDIELDDDCLTVYDYNYGDRDRACLSRVQPYYDPSDGGLVFSTAEEDGLVSVDLMGTVTSLAIDVLTEVDWVELIASTDLALYGAAEIVEAPVEIDVAFESPSQVIEFGAAPGTDYRIDVSGDYGDWDVYVVDEDGGWQEQWGDIWSVSAPTRARILVTSSSKCNENYCVPSGTGEAIVDVGIVEHIASEFPLETSGELGPGESVIHDFTVAQSQSVEFDVRATGASVPTSTDTAAARAEALAEEPAQTIDWSVSRVEDGRAYDVTWELPVLEPGQYQLRLTNYGSAAVAYTVTTATVDPFGWFQPSADLGTSEFSSDYYAIVTEVEVGGEPTIVVTVESFGFDDLRRPETSCIVGPSNAWAPRTYQIEVDTPRHYVAQLSFDVNEVGDFYFVYSCSTDYSEVFLGTRAT